MNDMKIAAMNLLTPDVATIGNHEVDYGLPTQLAGDAANVLEEYLMSKDLIKLEGVPRLVIHTNNP